MPKSVTLLQETSKAFKLVNPEKKKKKNEPFARLAGLDHFQQ